MSLLQAYFGGGCFWCTESVFQLLRGVTEVTSGYAGGNIKNPTYKEICSGLTGHAELVRITYDPSVVSYRELLAVFFTTHDPTTLNRQGADAGTQYRSVVFYQTDEEKQEVQTFIADEAKSLWTNPIVTQVSPLPTFYEAETYHQDYYRNNPQQGYCRIVIDPKIRKFREKFAHLIDSNA